jgi:hypothetical protein
VFRGQNRAGRYAESLETRHQTEYQYVSELNVFLFGFLGTPLLVKISYFHVLLLAFPRTKFEWSWLMELKVGQSCYSGDEFKQTRANFLRVFCCGALEHWRPRSQVLVCFCGDAARTANGRRASSATAAKGLQLDGGGPRQSWLNRGSQHDEG